MAKGGQLLDLDLHDLSESPKLMQKLIAEEL
jgi:hypothetical protein